MECLFKSAERSIGRLDELGVAGACVTCGAMSQVASASITSSVCFDGRPHCGAMAFTNLRSTKGVPYGGGTSGPPTRRSPAVDAWQTVTITLAVLMGTSALGEGLS